MDWRNTARPNFGRNVWLGVLMKLNPEFESPDFAQYKCYLVGGVLHLPHYTKPGVYVAPTICQGVINGRPDYKTPEYSQIQLKMMGAIETLETLWKTYARDDK